MPRVLGVASMALCACTLRHDPGQELHLERNTKMRFPTNVILATTAVMVVVIPVSLLLFVGGSAEGRYATGIALAGAGLLLIEKGAFDWVAKTRRDLALVYAAYAAAFIIWGISQFQPANSLAAEILFLSGAVAVVIGGLLHARKRNAQHSGLMRS